MSVVLGTVCVGLVIFCFHNISKKIAEVPQPAEQAPAVAPKAPRVEKVEVAVSVQAVEEDSRVIVESGATFAVATSTNSPKVFSEADFLEAMKKQQQSQQASR